LIKILISKVISQIKSTIIERLEGLEEPPKVPKSLNLLNVKPWKLVPPLNPKELVETFKKNLVKK